MNRYVLLGMIIPHIPCVASLMSHLTQHTNPMPPSHHPLPSSAPATTMITTMIANAAPNNDTSKD
jgi:hypothetical protein